MSIEKQLKTLTEICEELTAMHQCDDECLSIGYCDEVWRLFHESSRLSRGRVVCDGDGSLHVLPD